MYISTLPSNLALDWEVGKGHAPVALPRERARIQGQSGGVRILFALQRDSIRGPSRPQRVAIPTELHRPLQPPTKRRLNAVHRLETKKYLAAQSRICQTMTIPQPVTKSPTFHDTQDFISTSKPLADKTHTNSAHVLLPISWKCSFNASLPSTRLSSQGFFASGFPISN